jgi:prepilin-type N-terminal cleavage/methylation domain-containing protein
MIRSHSHSLRAAALGHGAGRASRRAFTLVELLVVIAIIALLVALVTAGVMKVMSRGPDAADLGDIEQLQEALAKFKARHGVFPPEYVKLCHFEADYDKTNPLDQQSLYILQRIWPSLFKNKGAIPWAGYDDTWNVKELPVHPATNQKCVVLQGDQCLVFFLGGLHGQLGFLESATYPVDHENHPKWTASGGSAPKRRKADFSFPPSRLRVRDQAVVPTPDKFMPFMPMTSFSGPSGVQVDAFPSYYDSYEKMPVVYFVGGNKVYNQFGAKHHRIEFPLITDSVEPVYHPTTKKYYNADSFQIITAGADNLFGQLAAWDNTNATVTQKAAQDNRVNFYPNHLGVEQ